MGFGLGITVSIICSVVLLVTYRVFKLQITRGGSEEIRGLQEKIETATSAALDLIKFKDSYVSQGQCDTLIRMKDDLGVELQGEKLKLKAVEAKLDEIQKNVEAKEFQQQEVKSSKEEDAVKLMNFLGDYPGISPTSVRVEQKIAGALKRLDQILESGQFPEDQRGALIDMQTAMTTAGSALRGLITEYDSLYERLSQLKAQHQDLEDEYTKLVEQQLGG